LPATGGLSPAVFRCAVEGRAQCIVSEDRDILDVGEYEGVRTIAADRLIALLSVD
jgi:predicted nucleic acid-binding protein